MTEKILVIALDGLDKELIEKYDLDFFTEQEEFGTIDNDTGIWKRNTSELYASFITGDTYKEHGVKGLWTYDKDTRAKILDILIPQWFVLNVPLANRFKETIKTALKIENKMIKYRDRQLESETLFEKIPASRSMFVPGYNPSHFWASGAANNLMKKGYSSEDSIDLWDGREHPYRKEKLFNELNRIGARPFLMCHFHRPDFHQHIYGDPKGHYDSKRLRELYEDTEELAKEIFEEAKEVGYTQIIFMSDHGLPITRSHNKNAFYSCNKELFGDEIPRITDFHDRIIEKTM